MSMKIWPLEKFERMMQTMFGAEASESQDAQDHRRMNVKQQLPRSTHEYDLAKALRNEKESQDRPQWTEVVPLRGFYLYIHDLEEKTKPVMVREYAKVQHKEDGEWPQFRKVPTPKCPFYDETLEAEREKQRRAKDELEKAEKQQHRTRAVSAVIEAAKTKEPTAADPSTTAAKGMPKPTLSVSASKENESPQDLGSTSTTNIDSMPSLMSHARFQLQGFQRPGREPLASGMQYANITAAIKSQMISSTAAVPLARAGTSKEMHQLQRRAIDGQRLSVNSVSSSVLNDIRAAINTEPQPAAVRARQKPVQTLTRIHEDEVTEGAGEHQIQLKKTSTCVESRKPKKDMKPGYCENCREKYEDFSEVGDGHSLL